MSIMLQDISRYIPEDLDIMASDMPTVNGLRVFFSFPLICTNQKKRKQDRCNKLSLASVCLSCHSLYLGRFLIE